MSRVRENRMHGSMGGSWKRNKLWQPTKAARGKPRDLSPARPTARHRASSLPDQPPVVCSMQDQSGRFHIGELVTHVECGDGSTHGRDHAG